MNQKWYFRGFLTAKLFGGLVFLSLKVMQCGEQREEEVG